MLALKGGVKKACETVDVVLDNFDVSLPIPSKVPQREKGGESSWNAALHFFWQVGGVILITITFFLSDSQWRLLILITSLPGISIVVLQYQYLRETSRFLLDKVGVYQCMDELEFIAESNQETIPGGAEAALSCLCSHLWCAR